MADFIVEVVALEVKDPTGFKAGSSPKCELMCLVGGQKAYNEFHNKIEVASRSYVRLWLFKHSAAVDN